MKTRAQQKPTGIRQIAAALGISIGTVDRALHGRSDVSKATRDRVLRMAGKLNYSPNVAARSLKLNRNFRLGVYLPQHIGSYYDALRRGIRAAANAETGAVLELDFHEYPSLGEGDLELMEQTDWLHHDGVILAPGHPPSLKDAFRLARERDVPIVCVTTDAAHMTRLSAVTADSLVSGSMAAELLGSWIQTDGDVALFTGDLRIQDHADKLRGFAATLATTARHLRLLPAIESHDSFPDAYRSALQLLSSRRNLKGIYVNTANCMPVLKAAQERRKLGALRIVTTDLFPDMVPFLERGEVSASLYQRPFTQGKVALEVLTGFLARGIRPAANTLLAPHVVLRSNLNLFSQAFDR